MKRLIKNEDGSVALIVALLMVVLIGFSAIVIDYGSIASNRRGLQNAVDAACLAAAQDLPDTFTAEDTAEKYLAENAPGAVKQSVSFTNGNKKVTMTATLDVNYEMARVFMSGAGATVTATASAIKTNVFGAYDYALFSGSEIDLLQFTGQNYVNGDVHSNNSVKNTVKVDGVVTAAGTIDGKISARERFPGYNVLAMPELLKLVKLASAVSQTTLTAYGVTYSNGTYTMSPDQLNAIAADFGGQPVYIDGNVKIDGTGVCATGCIIASGDLTFNGSGVDMSTSDKMCLATLNGNINFNGGGGAFDGILFSPKGEINFNGKIDTVRGSVIGNIIRGNGGLNILYKSDVAGSLPDTEIILVE